jgi:hypothetical protein
MKHLSNRIAAVVTALTLVACGTGGAGSNNDAPDPPGVDAPVGDGARVPTWMLEDIQPLSPRANQTYGLDTFGGKVVVAVLLQGF